MKFFLKRKLSAPPVLIILTLCVLTATAVILVFSHAPGETLYYFFPGIFNNRLHLGNFLNYSVLLTLTGLGIIIAFNAGSFNMGGEGQVYLGAISAVAAAQLFPHFPPVPGVLMLLAAGAGSGALLASLSGALKSRWKVDELISTFLLSTGVSKIADYLILDPMSNPESYLITTKEIPEQYRLASILPPSHLNISFLLVFLLIPLVYFYLHHSRSGYELRIIGDNREFARFGGVNLGIYDTMPLGISGGLHGLAGAVAVSGTYFAGILGFTSGLGWNGIAVALIASRNPVFLIPAVLFFSWMTQGARLAVLQSDLSLELGSIIQGVLFLLISSQTLRSILKRKKNL
jgi:riboflavin transport system permease protein